MKPENLSSLQSRPRVELAMIQQPLRRRVSMVGDSVEGGHRIYCSEMGQQVPFGRVEVWLSASSAVGLRRWEGLWSTSMALGGTKPVSSTYMSVPVCPT